MQHNAADLTHSHTLKTILHASLIAKYFGK